MATQLKLSLDIPQTTSMCFFMLFFLGGGCFTNSISLRYVKYALPVRSGDHNFQWKFVQGSLPTSEGLFGNFVPLNTPY